MGVMYSYCTNIAGLYWRRKLPSVKELRFQFTNGGRRVHETLKTVIL